MRSGHPPAGDVVELRVVALADHGDDDADLAGGEQGVDDPVVATAHGVGGGQHDRRLEDAPLANLDRPGQLAGAVEHGHAGRHRVAEHRGDVVGHDGRHPGSGHAVRVIAPHRDVADPYAGHVGDGVVLAGRHRSERQAQLTGSRTGWRRWHAPSLLGRDRLGDADLSSDECPSLEGGCPWCGPTATAGTGPTAGTGSVSARRGTRSPSVATSSATDSRRTATGSSIRSISGSIRSPPSTTRSSSTSCRGRIAHGSPKGTSRTPVSPTSCPTCSPLRRSPAGTCRNGARRRSAPRSACTPWTR